MTNRELAISLCWHEQEQAGRWFIAEDMDCDSVTAAADGRSALGKRNTLARLRSLPSISPLSSIASAIPIDISATRNQA